MVRRKRNGSAADLDTTIAATQPAKKGPHTNSKKIVETAATSRPKRASSRVDGAPKANPTKSVSKGKTATAEAARSTKPAKSAKPTKAPKPAKRPTYTTENASDGRRSSNVSVEIDKHIEEEQGQDGEDYGTGHWLMKAEPESRIEKGKDVKFSIDDLKAAAKPEGWDGVRNLAARNNMRAMSKGDQAFFYHSNCKVPGIVGIMEIVQESSVDESAFDPEHPYFDPKSDRDSPRWSLVHVEFRRKFPNIIKLKELQKFAEKGGVLENLQTLKQTRLSVSKVSKKEWDFILSLVDEDEAVA